MDTFMFQKSVSMTFFTDYYSKTFSLPNNQWVTIDSIDFSFGLRFIVANLVLAHLWIFHWQNHTASCASYILKFCMACNSQPEKNVMTDIYSKLEYFHLKTLWIASKQIFLPDQNCFFYKPIPHLYRKIQETLKQFPLCIERASYIYIYIYIYIYRERERTR